jgi:hypothetical protein
MNSWNLSKKIASEKIIAISLIRFIHYLIRQMIAGLKWSNLI